MKELWALPKNVASLFSPNTIIYSGSPFTKANSFIISEHQRILLGHIQFNWKIQWYLNATKSLIFINLCI
jgi:hypothetical protein